MGKMTSLLQRYNLIEKEDEQGDITIETTGSVTISDQENQQLDLEGVPSSHDQESTTLSKPSIDSSLNSLEDTSTGNNSEQAISEEIHTEKTSSYNELLTIDEIYEILKLSHLPTTDTVFLLENLIKALPEELPEFVKKSTINNIIEASAMNLPKLLEDGQVRLKSMERFSTEYTRTNAEEIGILKTEISRLSAIIADYHQQIKHKETLITDETNLIQTEQTRIQSILEFFK